MVTTPYCRHPTRPGRPRRLGHCVRSGGRAAGPDRHGEGIRAPGFDVRVSGTTMTPSPRRRWSRLREWLFDGQVGFGDEAPAAISQAHPVIVIVNGRLELRVRGQAASGALPGLLMRAHGGQRVTRAQRPARALVAALGVPAVMRSAQRRAWGSGWRGDSVRRRCTRGWRGRAAGRRWHSTAGRAARRAGRCLHRWGRRPDQG